MDKATLTISLPRSMKDFIASKLREGRFSTPSEYIRSLTRRSGLCGKRGSSAVAATRHSGNAESAVLGSEEVTVRHVRNFALRKATGETAE